MPILFFNGFNMTDGFRVAAAFHNQWWFKRRCHKVTTIIMTQYFLLTAAVAFPDQFRIDGKLIYAYH